MNTLENIFWILLFIICYTYLGYGLLLFIMVQFKKLYKRNKPDLQVDYQPEVTILVAAYNEKEYVLNKVENFRKLNYPKEKIKQMWVTDGSNDGTDKILEAFEDITVLHETERKGKIAAINRAMKLISTPIVIFSDANTLLGKDSVKLIVEEFQDSKTACVSGEKRIFTQKGEAAAAAGEGIYWKYESLLKKWDAELNSAVGAAGELFAIRTHLFQEVENDTLLDDFMISLQTVIKGYRIGYNSHAYAIENASEDVKEELKRKVRIAAGGFQSILRLLPLLNIFRYGLFSFQYISHRVLRWTLAPMSLVIIFLINILLYEQSALYQYLLYGQVIFYCSSLLGKIFENMRFRLRLFFVPYYFFIMNYAVFRGFVRFLKKQQDVKWEKAGRVTWDGKI